MNEKEVIRKIGTENIDDFFKFCDITTIRFDEFNNVDVPEDEVKAFISMKKSVGVICGVRPVEKKWFINKQSETFMSNLKNIIVKSVKKLIRRE
jgi:hypothetical protein